MTKMIAGYLFILVAFVTIDMVWLLGIAKSTYASEMGALLRKQPSLVAAGAFYLLYAAGIWFFAVRPALETGNWQTAVGLGAALGLVAYGTYDLTNLSILEGFGTRIALIDLAWGTFVTAATSGISAAILKNFG